MLGGNVVRMRGGTDGNRATCPQSLLIEAVYFEKQFRQEKSWSPYYY